MIYKQAAGRVIRRDVSIAIVALAIGIGTLVVCWPRLKAGDSKAATPIVMVTPPTNVPAARNSHSQIPASAPQVALSLLLTADELSAYNAWAKERGYAYDITDGGRSGSNAFSAYETMDEGTLKQLASSSDRRAALVLAEKLLEGHRSGKPVSAEAINEAIQLLNQATMLGYTTSLHGLIDVMETKALRIRTERKPGQGLDRQALVAAHMYGYLLEMRGDISIDAVVQPLRMTSPLNELEQQQAQSAARAAYAEMNSKRQAMGLPPFQDGVPPHIAATNDRFTRLIFSPQFKAPSQ